MSRDIFVQDMPEGISSPSEIPDDFQPAPLPFTAAQVRAAVTRTFPQAQFDRQGWASFESDGIDLEVSVAEEEPLMGFALFDRSPDRQKVDQAISQLLRKLDVRAFDLGHVDGMFHFL